MKHFFHKLNTAHFVIIAATLLIIDAVFFVRVLPSPFVDDLSAFLSRLTPQLNTKPSCKGCNIILISVDTLAANHLPCYGHTRNTSPNMCKFGQENIFVEDMSANSSYTLPSHVSIFTSLYPHEHKVNVPNVDILSKKIPFLPEELKKHGYETYFCMTTVDPQLPIDKVYNRGIDKIYEDWDTCLHKLKMNNKNNKKTFVFLHTYRVHSPYLIEESNDYLPKLTSKKIPSIPETYGDLIAMKYEDDFFHYFIKKLGEDLRDGFWGTDQKTINYYSNLLTATKKATTIKDKLILLDDPANDHAVFDYLYSYYSYKSNLLSKKQVQRLSDIYDIAIMEFDVYLGNLLDKLHKSELWNNTVIMITSDHGEEFMEHERVVGHGANLYGTTTKVPFMVHVPNTPSKRITKPVESVDIFPTLLDIVGIKNTLSLSGLSIFDSKKGIQKADFYYDEYYVRSARDEDWKLIIKRGENHTRNELFNLSTDPSEKDNLIFENEQKAMILQEVLMKTNGEQIINLNK